MQKSFLDIKNLKIAFNLNGKFLYAVNGVDLNITQGETLGLVGESGCGKSITAFSILNLLPEKVCRVENDSIIFNDTDLSTYSNQDMRNIRGNEIGIVFQDALASLDPVFTIGYQLIEAIQSHKSVSKKAAEKAAIEALITVGIPDAELRMSDYSHQLSGGMRQRVMIAIALINSPKLLIADEPTTALDVTIQAQILELIKTKKKSHNMAVLFITHDLDVIYEIADRLAVMYAGKIVELGDTKTILSNPKHPYTIGLISSRPGITKKADRLFSIEGKVPDIEEMSMTDGCKFAGRCKYVFDKCRKDIPDLIEIAPHQKVACFRSVE